MGYPPLRFLHADATLSKSQLAQLERLTEKILETLQPGQTHALKARADGMLLDGHHRVCILRSGGIDINLLPREIVSPDSQGDNDAE
jgi:hypothetical protein